MSFKADSAEVVNDFLKKGIKKEVEKPDFEEDKDFPDLEHIKGKVY